MHYSKLINIWPKCRGPGCIYLSPEGHDCVCQWASHWLRDSGGDSDPAGHWVWWAQHTNTVLTDCDESLYLANALALSVCFDSVTLPCKCFGGSLWQHRGLSCSLPQEVPKNASRWEENSTLLANWMRQLECTRHRLHTTTFTSRESQATESWMYVIMENYRCWRCRKTYLKKNL